MDLYLIRHGEPDYTTDSLTIFGHEQANRLAAALKSLKVDEAYKSPMGRAQQTALYSEKKWKMNALTVDWIRELSWGDAQGNVASPLSPWVKAAKIIRQEEVFPDGENWKTHPLFKDDKVVDEVEKRSVALDNFLEAHGYMRKGQYYFAHSPNKKQIVLFCHAGLILTIVSHMMNIPFLQVIAHTQIDPTSVTKIHLPAISGTHSPVLSYMNNTAHLK